MNPKAAANLQLCVDALKSGQYEQGTIYLNRDGKFDVLGVISDTYRKQSDDLDWHDAINKNLKGVKILRSVGGVAASPSSMLSIQIMEWAGISGEMQTRMIVMNDREKMSFVEIAEYLESFIKK